ncbi:PH domain-containing protein [Mumia zhuanghuii]|uniref:PH domain-containing protein n=1 Tax=Mumia zhuanghuii TaxID=2585211 RepID=A0A5C4MFF2_9ACTN|nr:PH domain-containing protein [Mumia zhuanghuii]TNC42549.1 PH domain-containing protein [Mumia zhuanghuii]
MTVLRRVLRIVPDRNIGKHLLLDDGERVKDVVRHHWVVFVTPYAIVLGGVLLIALFPLFPISVAGVLALVGVGIIAFGMYRAAEQHLDVFVITNHRVLKIRGVFEVKVATMPMARILDITVERTLLGRILGYGHFVFESAAQAQGLRDIRFIPDALERDRTIQKALVAAGLRGPAR